MWVKSEYAGELAVLSAWVSMLVPWNVAFLTKAPFDSTVVFLRFALFEVQFRFPSELVFDGQQLDVASALAETYPGTHFLGDAFLALPTAAITFYESPQLQQAGLAATGGALAFLAALALSVALYTREDAVADALDGREVQLMGTLLLAGAAGTAVATALYYLERGLVGTPIPVGVLVVGALGAVLLRTERV
ncbi:MULTISPECIES: DUF7549 family protein [Salinibaculum]|uniref:DUF7549 family protein n=1 Tax=Salinibaculum TaxID=2732368 RepID=UPI0030CC800C